MKPKQAKKPETAAEWSAYRCQSSCKIGRDAICGKTILPIGQNPTDYAIFNLLHAIEELSKQIEGKE